jgi:hypothetical protein
MRGYIYTLEILIAISVIFITMIFVFKTPSVKPELETNLIKQQGTAAIAFLEQQNLRALATNGNETGIKTLLDEVISDNIDFDVKICNNECSNVLLPENKTIIIIDHFNTGYSNVYNTTKLRLWLWEK